jgi:hypothetical protein
MPETTADEPTVPNGAAPVTEATEANIAPPEDGTARVERLLRYSASFTPETDAPDDLARRALVKRGLLQTLRQRSATARPWWSMGTVGVTVAAATLLYCQGALPLNAVPSALPSPFLAERPLDPVRVFYSYETGDSGSSRYRHASSQSNSIVQNAALRTTPSPVLSASLEPPMSRAVERTLIGEPEMRSSRVTSAMYRRSRERSVRPRRWTISTVAAERRESVEKPPVVRWEVEPPPRPQYRMYVPVVMTDEEPENGGTTGEIAGTPGVMEVAFEPSAEMLPQP